MAKSKTPAVRYLRYNIVNSETPGTETSHYIDLARDLSAINRRLYQQGRNYHVKRVSIVSSNTIGGVGWIDYNGLPGGATLYQQNAGRISFSTIPNSWTAIGAWKRGEQAWKKMQAKALAATGLDVRPTWNDYKVYLSYDMVAGTKPVPLDNGGDAVSLGQWAYSTYQSPDGTTGADSMVAHMLGAHNGTPGSGNMGSIGLIQSFGDARATVNNNSPTTQTDADDDPIANLFDDGTVVDEVIANMRTKGEDAPYDITNYPGDGNNHPKPLVVQETTLGSDGRATVGGFEAMCGLIEVECSSPIGGDTYSVLVELREGSFKGIAAEAL